MVLFFDDADPLQEKITFRKKHATSLLVYIIPHFHAHTHIHTLALNHKITNNDANGAFTYRRQDQTLINYTWSTNSLLSTRQILVPYNTSFI